MCRFGFFVLRALVRCSWFVFLRKDSWLTPEIQISAETRCRTFPLFWFEDVQSLQPILKLYDCVLAGWLWKGLTIFWECFALDIWSGAFDTWSLCASKLRWTSAWCQRTITWLSENGGWNKIEPRWWTSRGWDYASSFSVQLAILGALGVHALVAWCVQVRSTAALGPFTAGELSACTLKFPAKPWHSLLENWHLLAVSRLLSLPVAAAFAFKSQAWPQEGLHFASVAF